METGGPKPRQQEGPWEGCGEGPSWPLVASGGSWPTWCFLAQSCIPPPSALSIWPSSGVSPTSSLSRYNTILVDSGLGERDYICTTPFPNKSGHRHPVRTWSCPLGGTAGPQGMWSGEAATPAGMGLFPVGAARRCWLSWREERCPHIKTTGDTRPFVVPVAQSG